MKRQWEVDELIEHWTLLANEIALLGQKTGASRLGCAVLLKFFQSETQFPHSARDVPSAVVDYIAKQVGVPAERYLDYDWNGRTMQRHRGEIRSFLGIRKASVKDAQQMVDWLIAFALAESVDAEHLKVLVEQRFVQLKIEPPTPGRIERLIKSALRTSETRFFETTLAKLSSSCRAQIDALLVTSERSDEYPEQNSVSEGSSRVSSEEETFTSSESTIKPSPDIESSDYVVPSPSDIESSSDTTPSRKNESRHELDESPIYNHPAIAQRPSLFRQLNSEPGRATVDNLLSEITKLHHLRNIGLPDDLFQQVSPKVLQTYFARAATEPPRELRWHPEPIRYTLVAAFCWIRTQAVTDNLVDLLIQIVHGIGTRAERRVDVQLLRDFKKVGSKHNLLYRIAHASLDRPEGTVKDVIYPTVGEQTLKDLVKEFKANGTAYRERVHTLVRSSYSRHYRRIVPKLLSVLEFRSNNDVHRPVIRALELLKQYADSKQRYYSPKDEVPINGVLKSGWREILLEKDPEGNERINRINYEICVLQALRERLRCKEIWVVGANRYRNPDEDLPADFEEQRETYYQALKQPLSVEAFVAPLQHAMETALTTLNAGLPKNPSVKILAKNRGWICLSPLDKQPEPTNILRLKTELIRRWPMTSLLDILKETDLRLGFTECFKSVASRETLDRQAIQKRLLLCLYGLGTNTGLKRVSDGTPGIHFYDLRYIKRRFIHKEPLRNAITQVANAIFQVRLPEIWGEGTTTCASDSKKFGAWEQNLMTEWHVRYGGRGIMIYWHVEKKSTCIYSQLKTCSSSEVAAMIEGVLRHDTEMTVKKNFVDSHGQSEVAFAFSHLLGFELMPRLKGIHRQKLYRPQTGHPNAYPHLQRVLTRPINWELIHQQYDQMVKYATALRLGTAEPEAILRRFTRNNVQHPTYQALGELGKVLKTIFLCQYLHSEPLRLEINEGLNVVENWNSANSFIFYGKSGEIATNQRTEQEIAVLALHLLQISLVYINTLMLQQVLGEPGWSNRLNFNDRRALNPLLYGHVNPYGSFELDLNERLNIDSKLEVLG